MSQPFDFSTLITDRAQSDLSALQTLLKKPYENWTESEKEKFNNAISKGAYNYTDLNRVTSAMEFLNDKISEMGYLSKYIPIVVDESRENPYVWQESNSPTESQMNQYLSNVLSIYSIFLENPDLPDTMSKLTINGANQIETLLAEVNYILTLIPLTFVPCGEALCGGYNL